MLSQLVVLVFYQAFLFDQSTAQTEYYPCYSASCVRGKYCRVAEVLCVISPCRPQAVCRDNFPTNSVCRVGFPVLEMFGDKEIECSRNRICPDYTECINGRCCWDGQPSVSTVTPVKIGYCPDVTGLFGPCVERCSGDYNCSGNQKCCSNGCGRSCTDPVFTTNTKPDIPVSTVPPVKIGYCPDVTGLFGACVERCSGDYNCSGNQKCCSNGCGRSCRDPVFTTDTKPDIPVYTASPVKTGNCPDVTGLLGACAEQCSGDDSCFGNQKCCSNGCGRSCADPVFTTSTKPGTCPRPTVSSGICPIDSQICTSDNDCRSAQKCCATSCGRTCQNTIESSVRHGTCPRVYSFGSCIKTCNFDGNCPEGQKCCKKGCGRSCMATVETSSSRPGQCPALLPSYTCLSECSYDSDCSGTMKCCGNGCGRVCASVSVQSTITTCPQKMNMFFSCYFKSRCTKDEDCRIGENCCLSRVCGRICVFNQPLIPELPIISFPSLQSQRCTWWKFMYGQCRW